MHLSEVSQYVDQEIEIKGWLVNKRSSGKIHFLQLRDGTGFIQGTIFKGDVTEELFEKAKHIGQESSLIVRGTIRADERAPSGFELSIKDLEIVFATNDYPITPKEHGVDFLLDNRHLHIRHRKPWAILRVRDTIERAIHDFFHQRDFIRFDAPLFMPTAVEGTSELFEINLFDEDSAYLSQSGQLYGEAGALAFGKIYTFGPTFRAEKSKTRRHLLEFWMIEPEVAFATQADNEKLQEDFVSYIVSRVLEERQTELNILERDIKKLEPSANGNFPRISYDDALKILIEKGENLSWGDDFGAPHETIISESFDRPVIIHSYPAQIKAFYMQPHANDPRLAACNDMIAPEGYGEIIGGSERINDYELLKNRILEHDLPLEAFDWYLDLRLFGSVPHAGFGLGLERTIAWITGIPHLREAIPFPRMLYRMKP